MPGHMESFSPLLIRTGRNPATREWPCLHQCRAHQHQQLQAIQHWERASSHQVNLRDLSALMPPDVCCTFVNNRVPQEQDQTEKIGAQSTLRRYCS